jgi:hypothetical protein
MGDCCGQPVATLRPGCPSCGRPGRDVDRITFKALLHARALARLGPGDYRFCPTRNCSIVYYGSGESFHREDVLVPVFQKETEVGRTVCYCFAVSAETIRREAAAVGVSASAERIKALVKSGRCACEVRNPQRTCCLGDVFAIARTAAFAPAAPDEMVGSAVDE